MYRANVEDRVRVRTGRGYVRHPTESMEKWQPSEASWCICKSAFLENFRNLFYSVLREVWRAGEVPATVGTKLEGGGCPSCLPRSRALDDVPVISVYC